MSVRFNHTLPTDKVLYDMDQISEQRFCISQPGYPDIDPTMGYYHSLTNRVYDRLRPFKDFRIGRLLEGMAICIVNYYQDVIADGGIWHAFIDECRKMYGFTVPFFSVSDDYLDYELNPEDVRFLIWYYVSMTYSEYRDISPDDARLMRMSDTVCELLEQRYEDAPIPENWTFLHEIEINDLDDRQAVLDAANWLFLLCYLTVPANTLSMHNLLESVEAGDEEQRMNELNEKIGEAIKTEPTGPLALYAREWIHLIIDHKLPRERRVAEADDDIHPYFAKVSEAFGGRTLLYFKTYDELNSFFIGVLGWTEGERHLDALAESGYFAVMVDRTKGMLLSRDVARCIADPENPYFDKDYAYDHAFALLTERGRCPADLLQRVLSEGWLPATHFPGSDDTALVKDNADFIARCYLQLYYRGD